MAQNFDFYGKTLSGKQTNQPRWKRAVYVGSLKGGVKELNLTSNKLHDLLSEDENGESVFCRELLVASDNELWIGAESGLYIYNLRMGKYVHLRSSINDPYSLSDNAIYSLCT